MGLLDWIGLTAPGPTLDLGEAAPNVASRDEQGKAVRTSDFYGEGYTLVYFYPKADTPGCTKQACSLRDGFDQLVERGVRVVGVSSDSPGAQLRFRSGHHLPFPLLADEDRAVAKAFGVRAILGMPMRQSFLIKGGRLVWRDLNASTSRQAEDVLKAIERLG